MRAEQRWTWVANKKRKGIERMHSYRINGVPLLIKKKHLFFFFYIVLFVVMCISVVYLN